MHPAFTVTLSATPSSNDPLQVAFTAAAITGTPTAFSWAFGDGQTLYGLGLGNASPVHRYALPGTYTVTVIVSEGNQSATSSLTIQVAPAPLRVTITATNSTGAVPLTTTFTAVITGGTGTFRSVLWKFGDGGSGVGPTIAYSYVHAGSFTVLVNVTDSGGNSALGHDWVNVSASSGSEEFLGIPVAWLAGIAIAAAAGGGIGGALIGRWWTRRRPEPTNELDLPPETIAPPGVTVAGTAAAPLDAPPPPPPPPVPPLPEPAPVEVPRPAPPVPPAPSVDEAAPAAGAGAVGSSPEPMVGPGPSPAPAPGAADRPHVSPTALRLSQRIVLHLQAQGSLGPDEVARVAFTQQGMSESLSVRQNALTNVLRRLVAAEVVSEDVRHVQGQPRRLKVYRLTPRGESVARDLRGHRARAGIRRPEPPVDEDAPPE